MNNFRNYLILSFSLIYIINLHAFPKESVSTTTFKIISTERNSFKFLMDKADPGHTQIELISATDQKVLFSDEINARCVYWKHFIMKNTGDASYQMVITEQHKTTLVALKSIKGTIQADTENQKIIYHPIIKFTDDYLDINWLLNQPETVTVIIKSTTTDFRSTHVLPADHAINRRFNLNMLSNGNYIISLYIKERYYHQYFSK